MKIIGDNLAGAGRHKSIDDFKTGALAAFLTGEPFAEVIAANANGGKDRYQFAGCSAESPQAPDDGSQSVVFAAYQLQNLGNYRAALQAWFKPVRLRGYLIVVVPHTFLYDRLNALPSRWNAVCRRLYTPASLLGEIEEALVPNTYRIRWLGDRDAGYDYALSSATLPVGEHDIVVVIEKIEPPSWDLSHGPSEQIAPDYSFEPERTRVEVAVTMPTERVLVTKLDHLGDFIMGMPALEKIRTTFPQAEITLVVGSWNYTMAVALGLFERIVAFDAFPQNSTEEAADVPSRADAFDALITDEYDIAIDLRTDADTRILLKNVKARIKAGLGVKSQYSFLDIFLPIDSSRHDVEAAWDQETPARDFHSRSCQRSRFHFSCKGKDVHYGAGAIIWGPYRLLVAGDYIFEPFVEIEPPAQGLIEYDIAMDAVPLVRGLIRDSSKIQIPFSYRGNGGKFEFRLMPAGEEPVPDFKFYGGRLIKKAGNSVLHQSEYLILLVELVAMRMAKYGVLTDTSRQS